MKTTWKNGHKTQKYMLIIPFKANVCMTTSPIKKQNLIPSPKAFHIPLSNAELYGILFLTFLYSHNIYKCIDFSGFDFYVNEILQYKFCCIRLLLSNIPQCIYPFDYWQSFGLFWSTVNNMAMKILKFVPDIYVKAFL